MLHLVGYAGLYIVCYRLLEDYGQPGDQRVMVAILPVWLILSSFWTDMVFQNIYLITAWLASLLFRAVMDKRVLLAVVVLSVLLQTKPNWSFAMMIPLLFRDWKYLAKILGISVLVYLAIFVLEMVAFTPAYVIEQYQAYIRMLANYGTHPLNGPEGPFIGYNHSILQIVVWLGGSFALARLLKYVMLFPLSVVLIYFLINPPEKKATFAIAFPLLFVLYTGVFIWLDAVWEVSLGIVIFSYLIILKPHLKSIWWIVFLPFALLDLWQFVSVLIFKNIRFIDGTLFVLSDPSLYFPMSMLVILIFHYALITHLSSMRTKLRSMNISQPTI